MAMTGSEPTTTAAAVESVQKAVTTASVISHIRNNRVEYLLGLGLLHLLGVSDRLLAQMNGVCF